MAEEKINVGDFATVMAQIAEEKGIDKERVVDTVEAALAAAYKKEYGKRGQNIRAELNDVSGDMKFFLVKEIVDESTREFVEESDEDDATEGQEEYAHHNNDHRGAHGTAGESDDEDEEKLPRFNAERDITLEDAKKEKKTAKVGDILEDKLPSQTEFGRVAAQTAKQVIIQRIREAERDAMFDEYKEKEGEVISGTVQRIEGRTVFIDLGKSTGALFPSEQIRDEHYRIGQRVKVFLAKVESDPKGPGMTLSRSHPDMVRRLFELEVPEIFTGTVELKAVAREAGSRSKIAVYTEEEGVDPIGSCVGQKGTRVQAVIDELGGEKIDIIEWSEDLEEFISSALSPAKVVNVEIDEEKKEATVTVPDDQLSLAIGKRGQNVRLAVKLTGWNIDVRSSSGDDEKEEKTEDTPQEATEDVGEDSADVVAQEDDSSDTDDATDDVPIEK